MTDAIPSVDSVIDAAPACIDQAHVVATKLAYVKRNLEGSDRSLVHSLGYVIVQLSNRLDDYVKALLGLKSRRIRGYVVGYLDHDGRWAYIAAASNPGNLMRCFDVESAAIFPSLDDVKAWQRFVMRSHGHEGGTKKKPRMPWPTPGSQLAHQRGPRKGEPYRLQARPVRIEIGESVWEFTTA